MEALYNAKPHTPGTAEAGDEATKEFKDVGENLMQPDGPNAKPPLAVKEWQIVTEMALDDLKIMVREMFEASDANHDDVLQLDEFKQFSLYLLSASQHLNLI